MLIILDDSLKNILIHKHLSSQSPEIIALNNLAIAQRDGIHAISASYGILKHLINFDGILDSGAIGIYYNLLSKFSFLGAYQDFCTDYILVSGTETIKSEKIDDQGVFHVPLVHFANIDNLSTTILISEHISDCTFYYKIAQKYIQENRTAINTQIKLTFDHGGGSSSYEIYDHRLGNKKIVLSIADTDKSYPNDQYGETLKKMLLTYKKYKDSNITDLLFLDIREKENLVPPSFYLMCDNSSCNGLLKSLLLVEKLTDQQEKLRYLDIKDGVKAKSLKHNSEFVDYYSTIFTEVSDLIACTVEDAVQKKDDDILFSGIGQKLLDFQHDILENGLEKKLEDKRSLPSNPGLLKQIERLESNLAIKQRLFESLPPYIKNEWEILSRKIISWGIVNPMVSGIS